MNGGISLARTAEGKELVLLPRDCTGERLIWVVPHPRTREREKGKRNEKKTWKGPLARFRHWSRGGGGGLAQFGGRLFGAWGSGTAADDSGQAPGRVDSGSVGDGFEVLAGPIPSNVQIN